MKKSVALVFLLIFFVIYLLGAWKIDLMDFDATQYASISMQMYESGQYLEVQYRAMEYLDKPPLLFWLATLSFKLFGISHFAYRLPSILVMLLGLFSTYRFGKRLYNENTGLYASLILASCQGILQVTHDVRTDTLLIGFVIFSIWQLYVFLNSRKWLNFVLGFAGIGFAMLAKGPVGLMVPVLALGSQFIYTRQWKEIFQPKWFLGLLIILFILSPMILGLYHQHGWTGIKFFFWTQSFGRLTGENYWVDNTGHLFFVHTLLWTFLPWSLLAVFALVDRTSYLFKRFEKGQAEAITFGGFMLAFIAFSASQYKLPHYIFVVFPLLAILTAHFMDKVTVAASGNRLFKFSWFSQLVVDVLLWTGLVLIVVLVFPGLSTGITIMVILIFILFVFSLFWKQDKMGMIMVPALITVIGLNLVLNIHFYPRLTAFQAGSVAGMYAKDHLPGNNIIYYRYQRPSFDFYYREQLPELVYPHQVDSALMINSSFYIFLNEKGLKELQEYNIKYEMVKTFPEFHISMLTTLFLNQHTRENAVQECYLIEVRN